MLRQTLVAALLLLCVSGKGHAAKPCDADLDPVDGPYGYKPRPTRMCEGLFASRVGAPALELVSLTRGVALAGPPPPMLSLSVPDTGAAAHMRAIGIPPGLYYRMDAIIRPGEKVEWPADRILGRVHIQLSEIGLFAFQEGASGEPVYLPVDVTPTGLASSSAASVGPVAELRPSVLIDHVRWRFVSSADAPKSDWQDATIVADRIILNLPPNAARGSLQLAWADPETGESRHADFIIGGE